MQQGMVREETQLFGSGKAREMEEVMLFQSWKQRGEASWKSRAVQESIAPVLLPTQSAEGWHVPACVIQGGSTSKHWRSIQQELEENLWSRA